MSHDPAVAIIGGQLTALGAAAIASGAAAAPAVTALVPAGAEEVSMQAAMAFAAEAAKTLAAHAAAHEEISRTGAALVNITRMYAQTDATAAGALQTNAARSTAVEFESVGAPMSRSLASPAPATRLLRAEAVPGAAGTASMPAAMNAASTLLSAGSAPLSTLSSLGSSLGSVGQGGATAGGASAGASGAAAGGAGPALASSLTNDDGGPDAKDADGKQTGGELV
ncbi:hypothetical protein MSTO_05930 [Mycobacterium stomatepiae]|uniref:PE domain-containing protein n=2 Tax=Mycobacterium stomatepiae TaxID=470076 RepID=A0A7I7Q296_9MYCO|nr:hypothetical protein MSTO_05930 [Mycobacterium stomatepiae]